MKRLLLISLLSLSFALSLTACGKNEESNAESKEAVTAIVEPIVKEEETVAEPEEEPEVVEDVLPEGMVWSELTGLPIDEAIANQKPIAAMVDNEKTAWPHFGVKDGDIVYEIMNSTANDRITRFMVIYKDWGNIEQLGSIRSVRPTNFMLAAEYNAVLCHDGGPFYIDTYKAKEYAQNFSGIFSRVNNGKAREFTEYIVKGDLDKAFAGSKYSTEYDQYYEGAHFTFAPQADPVTNEEGIKATSVDLSAAFRHNASKLTYNESTGLYSYNAYGQVHKDGKTGEELSFNNVILQKANYSQLDDHGYLVYNIVVGDNMWDGYYITNGKAVKITWNKSTEKGITHYYLENGDELVLNKGKTYIGLIPDDYWDSIVIN